MDFHAYNFRKFCLTRYKILDFLMCIHLASDDFVDFSEYCYCDFIFVPNSLAVIHYTFYTYTA